MSSVLIVGAGPTGLTLAVVLARYGITARLIDKAVVPPEDRSRAIVIQARTLELFEDLGIVDEALAAGLEVEGANVFTARGAHGRIRIRPEWVESRYGGLLTLPQEETERILTALLESLGGRIEHGVELTSLTQDDDGVNVALHAATGTSETMRADWVIGCDGAHSTVRHAGGMAFPGVTYDHECMVGDVDVEWTIPDGEVSICPAPDGVLLAFPLRGTHRFRIIMILPTVAMKEDRALEREEFLAQLTRLAPRRLAPRLMDGVDKPPRLIVSRWLTRYRLHRRGVTSYRAGRCFVAGDAAHIHSPAGAQGMNTGIQDACNLGWKLALVINGDAPTWVIDTYHDERHRVGQFLLKNTDRMFAVLAGGGVMGRIIRRLMPAIGIRLLGAPILGRRLARLVSQTAIRYRHSRLTSESPGATALGRHAPRAGDRVPDVDLGGGGWLAQRLHGPHFSLLLFASDSDLLAERMSAVASETRSRCAALVKPVLLVFSTRSVREAVLDPSGDAHARFGAGKGAIYLVRPDGYIAWRGPADDMSGMWRAMALLLPPRGTPANA